MNILLFDADELDASGCVTVVDRRRDHLLAVLGAKPGMTLRAGVVRGASGQATVVDATDRAVTLRFEATGVAEEPTLSLVIAIPRPKALSRMVQSAASFGVARIDIINAWRVDASYLKSHKLALDVLAMDARLGCEQGGVTHVPDIAVHRFFRAFVDEQLGPRIAASDGGALLVGHPSEPAWPSIPIEQVSGGALTGPLTLAMGPDGGFVERELTSLTALGGSLVSFGDSVLRSEVALVAGLSQVALLRRLVRWGQPVTLPGRTAES